MSRSPDRSAEPLAHSDAVAWEYRVPLLTSRFMLWDFFRVIVLSVLSMFLLVAVMGWLVDGEFVLLPVQVLLLVSGIMAGLFAVACLLLGNHVSMTFSVEPEGITYATGMATRRWNRAAVILGLLAGRPGTAGAGLIATSQEEGGWEWAELFEGRYFPGPRVISVRNSWRTVLRLHCTPENYESVRAAVVGGLERGATERATAAAVDVESGAALGTRAARRRPWWEYATWVIAPLVTGVVATAWPGVMDIDDYRFIIPGVLLVIAAGVLEGPFRRIAASLALIPLGYVAWMYVEGIMWTSDDVYWETFYGYEYETGLLALGLVGLVSITGLALWRLVGRQS